jgi:hypothetical protein
LMDVNLEGGREGIEAARWLRDVCHPLRLTSIETISGRLLIAFKKAACPSAARSQVSKPSRCMSASRPMAKKTSSSTIRARRWCAGCWAIWSLLLQPLAL